MKVEVSLTISLNRSSDHYGSIRILSNRRKNVKAYFGGVHLVNSDNKLSYTEGEGEESVFTSLAIFRDTSFELTGTTSNDEDSTISLGSTGDHVFDEVTMSRGINDLKDVESTS